MSENVLIVRSAYEAFAKGDITAVVALLDDNVEWHEAEHAPYWPGGPFIGPQAVIDGVFKRLQEDYEGFTIDVRRIVDCGDTVLVEGRYRATARATGKPLDAQLAHVWDFRDGKVVRWQQYTDSWQTVEVTGFVPALAKT
jgi:ketosteroid isomerase-like protein